MSVPDLSQQICPSCDRPCDDHDDDCILASRASVVDPLRTGQNRVPPGQFHDVYGPEHYGGADNPYEAIKVIEAWGLGFCLGNAVKYISRAGKKDDALEDLRKARWYLEREIATRERDEREASTDSLASGS